MKQRYIFKLVLSQTKGTKGENSHGDRMNWHRDDRKGIFVFNIFFDA